MHLSKEEYALEQEIAANKANGAPITPEAKVYRDNSIYEKKLRDYQIKVQRTLVHKGNIAPRGHVFFIVTGIHSKKSFLDKVTVDTSIVTADKEAEMIEDLKKMIVESIDHQRLIDRAIKLDRQDRKKAKADARRN